MEQYDTLTGLPNEDLFKALFESAVSRASRQGHMLALMWARLDHYDAVCEIIGEKSCTDLLKQAAERIQLNVRQEDIVARVNDSEFMILIEDVNDVSQVNATAQKLLALFLKPMEYADKDYTLGLTMGIAMFPFSGDKASDLIQRAQLALDQAQSSGGNRFRFFTEELNRLSDRRLALEDALRTAYEDHEFFLTYEPIYDLHTNRLVAAETQLNWHSNQLGAIEVSEFVPVATQIGMMSLIREWELKKACEVVSKWSNHDLHLYVKIGRAQFEDDAFLPQLRSHLNELSLRPEQLSLKIDETTISSFRHHHADKIAELCDMGFHISVDHYGMGLSSLFQLKHLCIDGMRIDKHLIEKIGEDKDIESIISSAIKLAHSLDYLAVAVGVLNEEQLTFLKHEGCDMAQGSYFSKALDDEAFEALIQSLE